MIGLDLDFGVPVEKYEPDYDRLLGEAVSTSPVPVVCAYATAINTNPEAQRIPINMLSAALGLAGFANLTSDSDDFVRRQELIEAPPRNRAMPPPAHSFALRVAEKFAGSDAEMKNGKLVFLDRNDPDCRGPDHRHQLRRAARHLSQRLPGRFRNGREGRKYGSAAEMGERENRAGGDGRLDDRRATPFFTLVQRDEVADARR